MSLRAAALGFGGEAISEWARRLLRARASAPSQRHGLMADDVLRTLSFFLSVFETLRLCGKKRTHARALLEKRNADFSPPQNHMDWNPHLLK
jgi:hypothetical protein